ncbi:MAG: hypothetical protein PHY43_08475 [Verrucomicrobiales bacterium]|nr:hypothetical protein [Verrucomicrobiales bacterium]
MNLGKLFFTSAFAFTVGILISGCASPRGDASQPMLSVLAQFENAPAKGPAEADNPVRPLPGNGTNAAMTMESLPGNGLAQHPFLYYGEGNNVLYVVNHGKVVWTYAFPKGGEIDDAWMLSNGHIICTVMNHCYEVTPQKKIVWAYDCPANTEVHALQPVGLDKVMIVQNGLPPRLFILDKKDNSVVMKHELSVTNAADPKSVHLQSRNCRLTAQGTYLITFLKGVRVVEYDKDWKEISTLKAETPWNAIRLKNGNTLIPGDDHACVHELNPKGEIVWAIEKNDLPGIELRDIQSANRLANGNTVFCNRAWGAGGNRFRVVQVIEVTPDKKVVWALRDWNHLGSATGIQLLDQPGIPEKPGDLQR